jgi:hydroxymethylpyrimidine/phosphomethylpyrimidine kinase
VNARPPIVLSFAASDPTGGAGAQADILTLAALGCHPLTVLTALTAQDTRGVHGMRAVDADWVEMQALRLLEDMPVDAFKLGVLGSAANVEAVARVIERLPRLPVVLDPVLASGRGDALADGGTLEALRARLLPLTTVLTPNSLEARRLCGDDGAGLDACAARLVDMGCKQVLITGTHEPGAQVVNTLYDARGKVREDRWPRLPGGYHGSGCTLASALAAFLAKGLAVPEAAREAQAYTWKALQAGFSAGAGQSIPDRFHGQHHARPVRNHA